MVDQWIVFAQEKWWLLLGAVILLFVIINVVKTVFKWALIAAIIGIVFIYGSNYKDEITAMGDQVIAEAKEQAFDAFLQQAMKATYEANEDGTYAVYTDSVRAEGKQNSDEVTVYWKGIKIGTFKIDETIQAFIEQAKTKEQQ